MEIENEIFKRAKANFKRLEKYGFIKEKNIYKFSKKFMEGFRADIVVLENGKLSGKIFDLDLDLEYTSFRIKDIKGEFAIKVKENYISVLRDILDNCFDSNYFITEQANRISRLIKEVYKDEPEFAWEKSPGFGIFRNPHNQKWYGLIMNIDKNKIDKKCKGEVEVINVKLADQKIPKLLRKKGFYPSYHMNKKNWITIILDDTLSDDEVMEYIMESHEYTESPTEWLIPANPKYYDIINCFNETDTIMWKQSNNIKIDDIVYIYVGSPYKAILYKCMVLEVNIPYEYKDNNLVIKKVMKMKLLKRFKPDEYSFARLNEFGINAIRGPRNVPLNLSEKLNNDY